MDIRSDFHTHTNLSSCAADEVTAQALIDGLCGGSDGLRVLGISNHLWDSDVEGGSEWYAPQDVKHVLSLRKELESVDTHGARVLVGAEVEFSSDCRVAVTAEHAALFDYLLITANHVHMKNFIIPASMTDPDEVRDFIVKRFLAACDAELPVKCGICHPFFPMSFPSSENEILSGISDEQYGECFEKAKAKSRSIELHSSVFGPHLPHNNRIGAGDEYVRMIGIAKETGCTFHIGSDVHKPFALPGIKLREFAEFMGITEYQMTDF